MGMPQRGLSRWPSPLSIAMNSRVKGLLAVSAPRPPAGEGAEAEPGVPRLAAAAAAAASRWPMALSTNGDGSVNVPPSSPGEGGGIVVSSPGEGCGVNAVLLCGPRALCGRCGCIGEVHDMPKRSIIGLDAVTVDAA